MSKSVSPNVLRAAREELARQRTERTAKYERDISEIDAELAEIERAEKVFERWSGQSLDAETDEPEDDRAELADDTAAAIPRTHKEMVLEAVRRIRSGGGAFRSEIQNFIWTEYDIGVPPASISTYLARLKKREGLVTIVGGLWRPAGRWKS